MKKNKKKDNTLLGHSYVPVMLLETGEVDNLPKLKE